MEAETWMLCWHSSHQQHTNTFLLSNEIKYVVAIKGWSLFLLIETMLIVLLLFYSLENQVERIEVHVMSLIIMYYTVNIFIIVMFMYFLTYLVCMLLKHANYFPLKSLVLKEKKVFFFYEFSPNWMMVLFILENLKGTMYKQLSPYYFIQFWSKILNRFSKECKWEGIRYLILGLNTEVPPDHAGKYRRRSLKKILSIYICIKG